MALSVYNTLTREKEPFTPKDPKKVGLYVCGITPYDASHLGHARCYLTWDVFRRYLEFSGYHVIHVQNFTDIDDKIINRARELETDPLELSAKFSGQFFEEFDALGVARAHHYPKVTEHIGEIIALIQKIMQNGKAYESHGDVFFDVFTFKDYGKLSGQSVDDLVQGKRVEVNPNKRNPEDFALWKAAKPGEPKWMSPWGKGRPGWHIECSAMSAKYLGEQFDVHCGGQDLIFPHHENEIAQSEAATGKKPFVKYWLHNGFVTVKKDKMAKSLGNFLTVRQALDKNSPEAIRFFMLSTQYRQPVDFSDAALTQAQQSWDSLQNSLERMAEAAPNAKAPKALDEMVENLVLGFTRAMDDDLNTPLAIAVLFQLRDYGFQLLESYSGKKDAQTAGRIGQCFTALSKLLGVLGFNLKTKSTSSVNENQIKTLLNEREEARKRKDYAKADEIRLKLNKMGVDVEDRKEGGARWKAKK